MATALVIPIIVISILGLVIFLLYKLVVYDFICNRSVNRTLSEYKINRTQSEIIKEYFQTKGETISNSKLKQLEKHYRQNSPNKFLSMYEYVRDYHRKKDNQ